MQIIASESDEQDAFMDWAWTQPILREYMVHFRNERKTSWWVGKLLKHFMVRSGVSDYLLPYPSADGKHPCLWIELKRKKLYKIRPEQKAWIDKMNKLGHYACFAIGADEAIAITKQYLGQK